APHMMQNLFAKHLGLEEQQVRVLTKDVGGSFGIKVHTYADEMATVALSKLLKRPVKFVADRLESFITDIHARDHRVKSKVGVKFEKLSHHETLAHLDAMMNYAGLRAEQERLRQQGIYRGIGFASFIEVTNPSAAFYGVGGAKISAQDGATMKLDAQGNVAVH